MRRAMCAICLLLAAASALGQATQPAPASRPAEKPRLAVIDFRTDGKVEKTGGTTIAALVREEVQQSELFDLMDRAMMKERLTEQDFAATTECDQVKCLVRYGKTLDVQKIIGGFASSFGDAWVLNIRLVDVNTGREEQTFAREIGGKMSDLLKLSREGARELIGVVTARGGVQPTRHPSSGPARAGLSGEQRIREICGQLGLSAAQSKTAESLIQVYKKELDELRSPENSQKLVDEIEAKYGELKTAKNAADAARRRADEARKSGDGKAKQLDAEAEQKEASVRQMERDLRNLGPTIRCVRRFFEKLTPELSAEQKARLEEIRKVEEETP